MKYKNLVLCLMALVITNITFADTIQATIDHVIVINTTDNCSCSYNTSTGYTCQKDASQSHTIYFFDTTSRPFRIVGQIAPGQAMSIPLTYGDIASSFDPSGNQVRINVAAPYSTTYAVALTDQRDPEPSYVSNVFTYGTFNYANCTFNPGNTNQN